MVDPDSFDEIIEAFKKLDQNNDGKINEKDVHYSCSSHMLTSDENQLNYPESFLKLLNLNETDSSSPLSITVDDFFIFLVRNVVDYTDESVTNGLFMNLLKSRKSDTESDVDSSSLKADNLKSMMKKAKIQFTEDDLISMIEYAEFNNQGKLDQKSFSKLMQKLSSFTSNE